MIQGNMKRERKYLCQWRAKVRSRPRQFAGAAFQGMCSAISRATTSIAASCAATNTYSARYPLDMTARLRPDRLASYIALSAASTRLKENSSGSGRRVAPPTLIVT